MDTAPSDPTNGPPDEPRSGTRAAVAAIGLLVLSACAGGGQERPNADGQPTEAALQRVANSALPTGNVRVRFIEGVCYVTGNVQTAIDANAVARALRNVEGVERVELQIRREM